MNQLLAEGNRAGAAKYFMKDMVGAPAFVVAIMPLMPWVWRKLVGVAHTLPYDAAIMTQFRIPRARLATVPVPTLVMNGTKTDARLRDAARQVSAVIPGAAYRELAGQTHNVSAGALAPAVEEFLRS